MSTEEDDDIDNDDFEELLGAVKTDRERCVLLLTHTAESRSGHLSGGST